jgi:hypothetical protein
MRVSFSLLFAVILSLDAFAAPVPDANDFVRDHRSAADNLLTDISRRLKCERPQRWLPRKRP